MTVRELAAAIGLTERQTQRVLADLAAAGYITRHRAGRRNYYEVHADKPMRHPSVAHHPVGELLAILTASH